MNNQQETLLKKLAEKVKSRRKELNISQEELAYRCGFDRTYISLLEKAKRNLSFTNLYKLSQGLEIKLEKLLEGF